MSYPLATNGGGGGESSEPHSDGEGAAADTSFDESFNVSHISHYNDADEETRAEPAGGGAAGASVPMYSAAAGVNNDEDDDDDDEDTPPPPPPPRANASWFADPASSYDAFLQAHLQQQQQQSTTAAAGGDAARSPLPSALSQERQKLRDRKSGSGSIDGASFADASLSGVSAGIPASSPRPPTELAIPKLALAGLAQQSSFANLPAASSSALSARPATAAGSAASGSQTTRGRLSAFNLRLRAARRVQKWWRDVLACRPARQEAQARRTERNAINRADAALNNMSAAADPTRRLAFDESTTYARPYTAAAGAGARPSTAAPKQALAHLKEKLTARGGSGGGGRPGSAVVSPGSPAAAAVTAGRVVGRVERGADRTPSPPPAAVRRPGTAAAGLGRVQSTPPRSAVTAAPVRVRPFPSHAAPALRALLQGFLVRSQLAQRPAQELVRQIRDVQALIVQLEAERASGAKYDGPFLRNLTSQRHTLKEKLAALFEQSNQSYAAYSLAPPPSRVRFGEVNRHRTALPTSPLPGGAVDASYNAAGAGAEHPRAVAAGAAAMLKRKTVRRYLKKKEQPTLQADSVASSFAGARPSTAAPASRPPFVALSFADESSSSSFIDESSVYDSSSASAAAAPGASGAQTARSFLKRRSQKTAPAPRVDWKAVARPKVDAKHDEGSYLGPGGSNPVYESATGREWDERDRVEAGWIGGGGGGGGGGFAARPSTAMPQSSPNNPRASMPPLSSLPAERPVHRKTSSASGSQTARSSGPSARDSTDAPPPRPKVFKPSGHAGGALPIVANTDSGAPPLSPTARDPAGAVGVASATASSRARSSSTKKASRHIILAAKKMDLSRVKSRIDDSSPYKAAAAANSGAGSGGGGDSEEEEDSPGPYLGGGGGRARGHSASPSRWSGVRKSGSSGIPAPRGSPAAAIPLPVDPLTARARAAHARTGVTPTRDELRRLDEELRREQAELAEQANAWDVHAVVGSAVQPQSQQSVRQPAPRRSGIPLPRVSANGDAYAAPYSQAQAHFEHPDDNYVSGEGEESDSIDNQRLMHQLEAELDAAEPRALARHGNIAQRPASARPAYSGVGAGGADGWSHARASLSASPPNASAVGGGRIRSAAAIRSAQLSQQDLAIQQEIEDIERSLGNMSAFAQHRNAQARANAFGQGGAGGAVARPHTAAPSSVRSFSAAFDGSVHSSSGEWLGDVDDMPSEWKRTIAPAESQIPLVFGPASPKATPPAAAAHSHSPYDSEQQPQRVPSPRVAATLSPRQQLRAQATGNRQQHVSHLTQDFNQLSADVARFMARP